jgi:hypothetical protein
MASYYDEDNTRRGKLWTPPPSNGGGGGGVKAPILLAISLVLFQNIREEKRPLMPYDIHALTMAIVNKSSDIEKARTDWKLVLAWCLLAA